LCALDQRQRFSVKQFRTGAVHDTGMMNTAMAPRATIAWRNARSPTQRRKQVFGINREAVTRPEARYRLGSGGFTMSVV
jgi:hypothetical protein